jgi:hypothetical protein
MQPEDVYPHINSIQNTKVKAILCNDLFTQILNETEAETYTASSALLLPYLVNYVCAEVYNRILLFSQTKMTKAGPKTFVTPETESPSATQIALMMKIVQADINTYLAELEGYIYSNASSYPTYQSSDCFKCLSNKSTFELTSVGFSKRVSKYINENEITNYGDYINPSK